MMSQKSFRKLERREIVAEILSHLESHQTTRETYGDRIRVSCSCGFRSRWKDNMSEYVVAKNKHLGILEEI